MSIQANLAVADRLIRAFRVALGIIIFLLLLPLVWAVDVRAEYHGCVPTESDYEVKVSPRGAHLYKNGKLHHNFGEGMTFGPNDCGLVFDLDGVQDKWVKIGGTRDVVWDMNADLKDIQHSVLAPRDRPLRVAVYTTLGRDWSSDASVPYLIDGVGWVEINGRKWNRTWKLYKLVSEQKVAESDDEEEAFASSQSDEATAAAPPVGGSIYTASGGSIVIQANAGYTKAGLEYADIPTEGLEVVLTLPEEYRNKYRFRDNPLMIAENPTTPGQGRMEVVLCHQNDRSEVEVSFYGPIGWDVQNNGKIEVDSKTEADPECRERFRSTRNAAGWHSAKIEDLIHSPTIESKDEAGKGLSSAFVVESVAATSTAEEGEGVPQTTQPTTFLVLYCQYGDRTNDEGEEVGGEIEVLRGAVQVNLPDRTDGRYNWKDIFDRTTSWVGKDFNAAGRSADGSDNVVAGGLQPLGCSLFSDEAFSVYVDTTLVKHLTKPVKYSANSTDGSGTKWD